MEPVHGSHGLLWMGDKERTMAYYALEIYQRVCV